MFTVFKIRFALLDMYITHDFKKALVIFQWS